LPLAESASVVRERSDLVQLPEPRVVPPARGLRVLVVDDDAAILSTVRRVLRRDGHEVTVVNSAEAALAECRMQVFDVVLTDLGLGTGMDGWELAACIRRDWPRAQVILASGRLGIDAAGARRRGVDAVLSKPYQAADLRRLINANGRPADDRAA
jgi:CheY-like chemotaxis protein